VIDVWFKEVRKSVHFDEYHKGTLAWNELLQLIYSIKKGRKKGDKFEIQNDRLYILGEVNGKILYIINVKKK